MTDLQARAEAAADATGFRRDELGWSYALSGALHALQSEGWRAVKGREGQYEVSETGMVRRVGGLMVGQWMNGDGYVLVRFANPRQTARVHRLVAEAFIPNPDCSPMVNHINNDPADNRTANLEWCTQAQNLAHMTSQGRRRTTTAKCLSDEEVVALRAAHASGVRVVDLAARYGIHEVSVRQCASGRSYKHVPLPAPPEGEGI